MTVLGHFRGSNLKTRFGNATRHGVDSIFVPVTLAVVGVSVFAIGSALGDDLTVRAGAGVEFVAAGWLYLHRKLRG